MTSSNSDTCTIHNIPFVGNFTLISNKIFENSQLSWESKGLLCYILSRPPNWTIHTWQLSQIYEGNRRGSGRDGIKSIMKELIDEGYIQYKKSNDSKGRWIHRYDVYPLPINEFKKMFPQTVQPATVEPALVKPSINNNTELTNTELSKNICADKIDAKKSKKVIKKPEVTKISRRENVFTSEEEHSKLKDKFGAELLERCYDHLRDWKVSKAEVDPRAMDKHTDYYRIIKWVEKSVKDQEVKVKVDEKKQWEKQNRDLFFMLKEKYAKDLKNCIYSNGFIINKDNGKDITVNIDPKLFKDKLQHVLGGEIYDRDGI